MGQHARLDLQEAFGVLQSGLPVDEFLKRARAHQEEGRGEGRPRRVKGEEIDAFIDPLNREGRGADLRARRAHPARRPHRACEPVAFVLETHGDLEKLQVVALTRRSAWDAVGPGLERDPKLAQKPLLGGARSRCAAR